MEWLLVTSLILIGLGLIVVEIIFVPGTTLVGVVGFVFMLMGVGLSFRYFGGFTGWTTTASTVGVTGVTLFFSFKSGMWDRFSLKTTIDSKVNEGVVEQVRTGTEGITLSALRPSGKAELQEKTYEVRTMGNYLEAGIKIRVMQILSNQIIVEPLT